MTFWDWGDWGFVVQIFAVIGGIYTGLFTVGRTIALVAAWKQKRDTDSETFSKADKQLGKLADDTTVTIREIERKFDNHSQEFNAHSLRDEERFTDIGNTLISMNYTLGQIQGALGRVEKSVNGKPH